jgi:phosphoribosylaminoimidazole-succinocarboxamide synthase
LTTTFNNNRTLYEELQKKELPIDNSEYIIEEYSDYFTNGSSKKIRSKDIGEKFASINAFFFDYLKEYHIPAAFIKNVDKNHLKFIKHEKFPFYVKILNIIDKRTAKIFGDKEGKQLVIPLYEFHFGDGKDTLISESHLISYNLCSNEDLKLINRMCSKINAVLKSFFERRNLLFAEVCCNFGKCNDKIYLIDDFTPKSLKVLPLNNGEKWCDPYKLTTSAQIKNYTNQIYNLMSVQ